MMKIIEGPIGIEVEGRVLDLAPFQVRILAAFMLKGALPWAEIANNPESASTRITDLRRALRAQDAPCWISRRTEDGEYKFWRRHD